MRAMAVTHCGRPLEAVQRPVPLPQKGQVLVRVRACGVCRTDLHVRDGELPAVVPGIVPGHEVVGVIEAVGPEVTQWSAGQRVGVPWLGWTCGQCRYCQRGQENLCDAARFTGYTLDGGYAEYLLADARYCLPLPDAYDDVAAAPLLCAGLIGYRALKLAGPAERLGLYGFGAAAHLVAQVARWQGRKVYAFVRPGDEAGKAFARACGAVWAGGSDERPPEPLDAAILFAPVGALVPAALAAVDKGGVVVCGGIHMSDIPSFPYRLLWGERVVRSVANLTRADGQEFLALAEKAGVKAQTQIYPLAEANRALDDLAGGRVHGAAVLVP
jgi:propanol-preferring alcohol dehydrogenase